MKIAAQVIRFSVVGGVGFVVDGGLLYCLTSAGFDPVLARSFSFPLALISTFTLNRIWTFKSEIRTNIIKQFFKYLASQLVGATANFICFAVVLSFMVDTPTNSLIAFALASGIGMFFNFAGSKFFVFRQTT
ncbi:MAG: hypothetical protein CMK09_16585 [Ponticaulis sp.]|nr:hypothetical protein [Ponticaulis sp.]|tara:strand:+ start:6697 stop:7092 length:396 start_codon:yes stop_codon:yes gene_type:complete